MKKLLLATAFILLSTSVMAAEKITMYHLNYGYGPDYDTAVISVIQTEPYRYSYPEVCIVQWKKFLRSRDDTYYNLTTGGIPFSKLSDAENKIIEMQGDARQRNHPFRQPADFSCIYE
jgi:hypothetical protein